MKEKVRVAGGQGFWGDLLTAPVDQVRDGQIDYLMLGLSGGSYDVDFAKAETA